MLTGTPNLHGDAMTGPGRHCLCHLTTSGPRSYRHGHGHGWFTPVRPAGLPQAGGGNRRDDAEAGTGGPRPVAVRVDTGRDDHDAGETLAPAASASACVPDRLVLSAAGAGIDGGSK
jgi:hypothetical protein